MGTTNRGLYVITADQASGHGEIESAHDLVAEQGMKEPGTAYHIDSFQTAFAEDLREVVSSHGRLCAHHDGLNAGITGRTRGPLIVLGRDGHDGSGVRRLEGLSAEIEARTHYNARWMAAQSASAAVITEIRVAPVGQGHHVVLGACCYRLGVVPGGEHGIGLHEKLCVKPPVAIVGRSLRDALVAVFIAYCYAAVQAYQKVGVDERTVVRIGDIIEIKAFERPFLLFTGVEPENRHRLILAHPHAMGARLRSGSVKTPWLRPRTADD